jgi:hypothetical protein
MHHSIPADSQPHRFGRRQQGQSHCCRGTCPLHTTRTKTDLQVTGSNVVSVAEHVLMSILVLVRNFVPAHDQARSGEWNVANIARNTFDLEDKVVGTVGCGRIGYRVLQRLQPFGCKELLWHDYTDIPESGSFFYPYGCMLMIGAKSGINARRVESLEEMVSQCDVVTIVSHSQACRSDADIRTPHSTRAPRDCSTRTSFLK